MVNMSRQRQNYECIITSHDYIWYCKNCKRAHGSLYIDNVNNKHYCELCIPDDVKSKAIKINENGEMLWWKK